MAGRSLFWYAALLPSALGFAPIDKEERAKPTLRRYNPNGLFPEDSLYMTANDTELREIVRKGFAMDKTSLGVPAEISDKMFKFPPELEEVMYEHLRDGGKEPTEDSPLWVLKSRFEEWQRPFKERPALREVPNKAGSRTRLLSEASGYDKSCLSEVMNAFINVISLSLSILSAGVTTTATGVDYNDIVEHLSEPSFVWLEDQVINFGQVWEAAGTWDKQVLAVVDLMFGYFLGFGPSVLAEILGLYIAQLSWWDAVLFSLATTFMILSWGATGTASAVVSVTLVLIDLIESVLAIIDFVLCWITWTPRPPPLPPSSPPSPPACPSDYDCGTQKSVWGNKRELGESCGTQPSPRWCKNQGSELCCDTSTNVCVYPVDGCPGFD